MLYDFVVIGNTPEAILAAIKASYLKDRVILVYPPSNSHGQVAELIFNRRFTHLNNSLIKSESLDNLKQFAEEFIAQIWGEQNLANLAPMGIDVIVGEGEFYRLPRLGFVVNNKKLRSPFYLIATGSDCVNYPLGVSEITPCLTQQDIWAKNLALLPDNLLIIGGNSHAIPLAQNLRKIGKLITLVVESKQLLPEVDRECSFLIQAQLESEGVKIFTDTTVSQIKKIEEKKWVQVGNKAIAFDEIIVASGKRKAKIEGLNLEGVRVKTDSKGIVVNEKLQTTNRRIYACGSVISGNDFFDSVETETDIAVNNALIFSWRKINYHHIPSVICSSPPVAKIGLTEIQAKNKYRDDLFVAREYYKNNAAAQILEQTTGFCKLIAKKNGEIVGAQIVGSQAEELIAAIALAINNKIRLGQLAHLPLPELSLSKILLQSAKQWQREQIRKNKTLLNIVDMVLLKCLRSR
jgi:pyruvate/2-oxoglutarate dehydrogenase complex dihydrolipoamide dehydrogenase (E3) component